MAVKTKYTDDFKKKVVEEYRKGDLSLEELAAKYGLPQAIIQDWINKDDVNTIFVSYVERPKDKTPFFTKVEVACGIAFQSVKANGWLMAGCLPLLICLATFIKCNGKVVESEINESSYSTEVKMDSLIYVNSELKGEISKLGVTLESIEKELKTNIAPNITINRDIRSINHRTRNTSYKDKTVVKIEKNEVIDEVPKTTILVDTSCCRCPKDTIR